MLWTQHLTYPHWKHPLPMNKLLYLHLYQLFRSMSMVAGLLEVYPWPLVCNSFQFFSVLLPGIQGKALPLFACPFYDLVCSHETLSSGAWYASCSAQHLFQAFQRVSNHGTSTEHNLVSLAVYLEWWKDVVKRLWKGKACMAEGRYPLHVAVIADFFCA